MSTSQKKKTKQSDGSRKNSTRRTRTSSGSASGRKQDSLRQPPSPPPSKKPPGKIAVGVVGALGKLALISALIFFVAGILMFALAAWCVAFPFRRRADARMKLGMKIAADVGAFLMVSRGQKVG